MRLDSLTYPEARAIIDRGAIALWPVGSTEAHGPHLPLATDVIIAEETCRRAESAIFQAHSLEVLIAPPLAFTITEFARPFSGTISVPKATAIAYVRDVATSLAEQGFRAVCLVNAHLEPAHRFALRDAVAEASSKAPCPIGLADPADRRFASTLTPEFASGSCHAGQYETSLVMAAGARVEEATRLGLLPREVDLVEEIKSGARNFIEAGLPSAYCGAPAAASRSEGESSYARLVEIVLEIVRELIKGSP